MKKISEAELEVLKIIWSKKVVTSMDIIKELNNCSWSVNTVRTLIKRLYEKQEIEIVGKKGKVYYYKAKISEDKYKFFKIKQLLDKLFDGKIENLLDVYKQNN